MAKKGLYQRLFQLQAAGYADEPTVAAGSKGSIHDAAAEA